MRITDDQGRLAPPGQAAPLLANAPEIRTHEDTADTA
jgi:hypothetical protein